MRPVHVITPGDHFSPSTGSAIPTVVDGLCRYRPDGEPLPAVAVARGTYSDRYDSAEIIEYDQPRSLRLPRPVSERHVDGAFSLLGLPRWLARRSLAPTVGEQSEWVPSVVLAHNAPQLIPLVDATKHAGVLYAHNHVMRTYRDREARRVLGSAAGVVCVSDSLANQTLPHLPAHLRDRVRVVRNGVDYAAFRRITPLTRSGPLKVLFVGRMIPEKGADVLVDAVRKLDRPDIHLALIGSSGFDPRSALTEYERTVRETASTLGDRASVRPFVPRREVAAVLKEADVIVVPSRWPDPCPLTVLEGMAAGAAVIGSDIGGIPESLRSAGIVVPANDSAALAEAIEALADDESLLRNTANACAEYAQAHDWEWASANLATALRELS